MDERESSDDQCMRHARHYLAKSLIRLDELKVMLKYPGDLSDPLKAVEQLQEWTLEALKCASFSMHTIPVLPR